MPEAGGREELLGSIGAPYIGAAFEHSRILRKVLSIYSGRPEVPVYNVAEPSERDLWAFRNMHAFKEYTSPMAVHWYVQVLQDWKLDIRTSSQSQDVLSKIPPPDKTEFKEGVKKSEKFISAMMAVAASVNAMEISAGAMDKYIGALVGDDPDRADTWSDGLVHGDEEKLRLLKANPVIRYFYNKLVKDAFKVVETSQVNPINGKIIAKKHWEVNPDSQLADFLISYDSPNRRHPYKGGFKAYIEHFLLPNETTESNPTVMKLYSGDVGELIRLFEGDVRALVEVFGKNKDKLKTLFLNEKDNLLPLLGDLSKTETRRIEELFKERPENEVLDKFKENLEKIAGLFVNKTVDSDSSMLFEEREIRETAASLATDIFLVDELTEWEYLVQEQIKDREHGEISGLQSKPTPNWGGNPLTAIIRPSFLPEVIKGVYAGDPAIMRLVDNAYTFEDAKKASIQMYGEDNDFVKYFSIKPTMTAKLKSLYRYGRSLMGFFGGSTAASLPEWEKEQVAGKEGFPVLVELPWQDVARCHVRKNYGSKEFPFGKEAMGDFVSKLLYIKTLAAVRRFRKPGILELVIDPKDRRSLREIAETFFGSRLNYSDGYIRATTERLDIEYSHNFIRGADGLTVMERLDKAKDILCLSGEFKDTAKFARFLQVTFGAVGAVVGSGGGGRGRK